MARKKPDADEAELEPTYAADRVEVEVIVPHVFLPLDEAGNVPTAWREAPTVLVEKGTKLAMPADLIEVLGDKVARTA